jgi:hypothetical protein
VVERLADVGLRVQSGIPWISIPMGLLEGKISEAVDPPLTAGQKPVGVVAKQEASSRTTNAFQKIHSDWKETNAELKLLFTKRLGYVHHKCRFKRYSAF